MDTLNFICNRYKIDLNETSSPIKIPVSRWHDMGCLFNDLGFRKGVELGVYRGNFTSRIAKKAPNLELIGVDAWTAYPGYNDYDAKDLENEAYVEAMARTKGYKNVKFIKGWSLDVVKRFENESLDFVFIDANHNYEYVVADIASWSKKVRKGGLVLGHDYFKNRKYNFGVVEAVNGWCSAYDIKPLFTWADKCPSWMYVKR
ncbi:MAG: class I SAM-dependent methyltransferase [Parcubacteria group bacterium]|nr:class I SAM-dependent methyltransferase [Parcubacteria group bacterium]